mgnify:FL=1
MGRKSRRKGCEFERELAGLLTNELGFVVKRRLGQAREGGCDLTECGPFVIEAKRRARIGNVYDWHKQAADACNAPGQVPVVVMRADGKKPLALLALEDLIPMMREALGDIR